MAAPEALLKLAAMDAEDLAILSAHLQDAVATGGQLGVTKVAGGLRFTMACNRFDWASAEAPVGVVGRLFGRGRQYQRRRSAVLVDHVRKASYRGLPGDPSTVLNLLAIRFRPAEGVEDEAGASGTVTLDFAGDAAVRLEVDCLEVRLADEGSAWSTHARPDHRAAERFGE